MLVLSACDTGGVDGQTLINAIGGVDFVMMAWSARVANADAFKATVELIHHLGLGLTSREAYQRVVNAGFASATFDGRPTRFEYLTVNGENDAVRLIELPTLLDDAGNPMVDGTDVSNRVTRGNPGQLSKIQLDLRVDGVIAAAENISLSAGTLLATIFSAANTPPTLRTEPLRTFR